MDHRKNLRIFSLKLKIMKMFYDDFEVGDTIGYDENWDGRLTGRMIEHVLTEISLKDIKTWETKDNPHNMRIIKKGINKTTQQIIDEDFEGGLTMGQLQCKDCNDNLTDCTCIEDTIDMKQTPGKETADYIDRHVVEAMVEVAKQKMYSEEEVKHLMTLSFEQGFKKADIVEAGLEAKETDTEVNWIFLKHKKDYDNIHGKNN